MTVLFVNACLRGDESRTLTLCREYLEGIEDVKEVNLSEMRLEPYYGDSAAYRAQLEAKGLFDDPMFDIGKDFAEADRQHVRHSRDALRRRRKLGRGGRRYRGEPE